VQKQEIVPVTSSADPNRYQEGLLSLWTGQDGKIYGLPKDFDTIGWFYNSDMLKDAGYTADDLANATWNPTDGGTFEKIIAHLTIDKSGKRGDEAGFDKNNVKTYGFNLEDGSAGNGQTQWSPFTGSAGWQYTDKNPWGTHYNYDQATFQDTLTWYRSLIDKGYMQQLKTVVGADTGKLLAAGTVASTFEGDWNTSNFIKQLPSLKIAPVPASSVTGKRASMFNGLADSINANSKNTDLDQAWVAFTGSAACQDLVAAQAVVFPAVKTSTVLAEAAFKAKGVDPESFLIHIKDGTTFLFPITDHASDITAIMGPGMQAFLSHEADASSFTDLNDQVNQLFN
jgi:multiple sugar transport system substrate-binding protein